MPSIPPDTVFTKTAKGLLELNNKVVRLPRELSPVLFAVDGKATVAELLPRTRLGTEELERALARLLSGGYIESAAERGQRGAADGELDRTAFPQIAQQESEHAPEADRARTAALDTPRTLNTEDTAERVRDLNERARAERRAREEAQQARRGLGTDADAGGPGASAIIPNAGQTRDAATGDREPFPPVKVPQKSTGAATDLNFAADAYISPQHAPTALERAMMELAARKKTGEAAPVPPAEPRPRDEADRRRAAAEKLAPMLEALDEPGTAARVSPPAHELTDASSKLRRQAEAAGAQHEVERAQRKRFEEQGRRRVQHAHDKRRRRVSRTVLAVLVLVPAAIIAWLQFVPMNGYLPAAQDALSQGLHQPVTLAAVRYKLLPTPRLVLEDMRSSNSGLRAERIEMTLSPWSALAGRRHFKVVNVYGVEVDAAALAALPALPAPYAFGGADLERLRLHAAKVHLPQAELGAIDADVIFAGERRIERVELSTAHAKLDLMPEGGGVRFALNARDWRIPYGPPTLFAELLAGGLITSEQSASGEFRGNAAGGRVDGRFRAAWGGPVTAEGEFKLLDGRLEDLAAVFKSNVSGLGLLAAAGRFTMKAPSWQALRASAQIDAGFSVVRGEIVNIDLVRALKSPTSAAIRGGRTSFDRLSGLLHITRGQQSYRDLELASGPLNANGFVAVSADGRLSGRLRTQLATPRGVLARSAFSVTGTLDDPRLIR